MVSQVEFWEIDKILKLVISHECRVPTTHTTLVLTSIYFRMKMFKEGNAM